ncbi:hypothetical protein COY45_01250 [Candidatus Berkelbacteria bacterium CG_4_10_14_0_8_um_filter_42_34]|uniref:Uncharacterized protein n=1 Tax=Candidatus Berkelbacteria bacterium CG_4_10_14_0_8_um_filter_42_34 TaxID=1974502 RepID=A0A2M7SWX5_9BACT|nr:MAG: hypothetical protein COY45_01250 [Candidatus Berkelbacteria bacterium CG_4_10_14_0_8_um_filter_42_34]
MERLGSFGSGGCLWKLSFRVKIFELHKTNISTFLELRVFLRAVESFMISDENLGCRKRINGRYPAWGTDKVTRLPRLSAYRANAIPWPISPGPIAAIKNR